MSRRKSKKVILHSKAVPMCSNRFDQLCLDSTFLRFYESKLLLSTPERTAQSWSKRLDWYWSSWCSNHQPWHKWLRFGRQRLWWLGARPWPNFANSLLLGCSSFHIWSHFCPMPMPGQSVQAANCHRPGWQHELDEPITNWVSIFWFFSICDWFIKFLSWLRRPKKERTAQM